ncbi:hypothetical protein P43SY_007093 [Pythium insidiosum]|uniref:Uncharacterized protein n=1 Tax=Pythium insidiosum TaxID=114742 RepID=A0AAD5LFF4_PYTIN|nr:hypothetical protein P43SY_007093 [Pythium insidiosum]
MTSSAATDFRLKDDALQVFTEDNVDRLEESIRVKVFGQELALSLLLKEDELAPLFSGAAWAGTLLWDAAQFREELRDPDNRLRVIELGAGISGVPGMAARVAGAHHVVITEQDDLLELMHRNLADNASVLRTSAERSAGIHARPLSWGISETTKYLDEHPDEPIDYLDEHPDEPIDVILSCDCIYEPLYGQSWRALAQTMQLLCERNPQAVVLMCVERRNQDGIDKFLAFVDDETKLECTMTEQTIGATNNTLQLYSLKLSN